jgi:hypothetical protein
MAKKGKIEFIDQGFRDILSSDGCKAEIEKVASQVASRAGANFSPHVKYYGPAYRYIGFVNPNNYEGVKEESENKVLSSAVR